jgi:transaldolase
MGVKRIGFVHRCIMKSVASLRIRLFADGADVETMRLMAAKPHIQGLTTNPTLMRQAGVTDYRSFAMDVLRFVVEKPISFEVFSDDFAEMEDQAHEIASWGSNVFVKIPITNTKGQKAAPLIERLAKAGIQLNITAILTLEQVMDAAAVLRRDVPSFVSVFAGRIADTGRDPVPLIEKSIEVIRPLSASQLIWASPRELLNVFQADAAGCHVITATSEILEKLALVGKDLGEYSLDTVRMFHRDAQVSGFSLNS